MERLTAIRNGVTVYVGPGCEYSTGMIAAELNSAHIRLVLEHLNAYEETGLKPEEIMGLCSMDKRAKMAELLRTEENRPLTLEELRQMGGKPYWHVGLQEDSPPPHWNVLDPFYARHIEDYGYGKRWLAYRYELEAQHELET